MPSFLSRLKHSWNAFLGRDPTRGKYFDYGRGSFYRPDTDLDWRPIDKSILTTIENQIAVDASSIDIEHCLVDESGNYKETVNSNLNECLTVEANVDQTGRAFIQDLVMSMFDEGIVAAVITDADIDPNDNNSYDILSLRVGRIMEWFPYHVRVEVYNERLGYKEEIIVEKAHTAIIQNPFYEIMNRSNSTLQRLKNVLNGLDVVNNEATSGKMDMIIQLPYLVQTPTKIEQAERRRKRLEEQLEGSRYGIGYIDGTEKIVQLNRPLENNLWKQAQDLTTMLYNQLGLTPTIFDGTADDNTMTNYYNRTVNPILRAITEEMTRKFLTKNARTRGHRIHFFQDPFSRMPISSFAEASDKMSRNEIMSSNELRSKIGMKPVDDTRADELRNKNISQKKGEGDFPTTNSDDSGDVNTDSPDNTGEEGDSS